MKVRYFGKRTVAMEMAIAYSFLNMTVSRFKKASKHSQSTLLNLEESGLIKLVSSGPGFLVKIPFVFLRCYIETTEDPIKTYWNDLLMKRKMHWQEWESFNINYFAFRLSLFAALGQPSIPLRDFFRGSLINIPDGSDLLIPSIDGIELVHADRRYPQSKIENMPDYSFFLNADGAAFDGFVSIRVLRKGTGHVERKILALQMKSSDSAKGQKITNDMIEKEYNKVKRAMDEFNDGAKFILVILGRCEFDGKGEGKVEELILPNNVALVTMSEHKQFYGSFYSSRLGHPQVC